MWEARLADFEMSRLPFAAKNPDSIATSSQWHETYGYIAPEVLIKQEEIELDPIAADSWSVGCILFFILYRSAPFKSTKCDLNELLDKQKRFQLSLSRRIEPPEDIEGNIDEAKKIMVRHWLPNPARRPTPRIVLRDASYYAKWSGWWPIVGYSQLDTIAHNAFKI